jgi:hypothetical protein
MDTYAVVDENCAADVSRSGLYLLIVELTVGVFEPQSKISIVM